MRYPAKETPAIHGLKRVVELIRTMCRDWCRRWFGHCPLPLTRFLLNSSFFMGLRAFGRRCNREAPLFFFLFLFQDYSLDEGYDGGVE